MEIGTAEPLTTPEPKRKRRSGLSSGGGGGKGRGGRGGGGGGGNGGGGGGGDEPRQPNPGAVEDHLGDKSRIVTGFLLLIVMMTFGGLIAAYVVIATNNVAEWSPFDLPIQVWISTVIIVISSFAYHAAQRAIERADQESARKWLIITTALGAAFISSQILVWFELVRRGFYVYANPYAGFFYILTAVHAVHVLGGVIALGAIVLRTWRPFTDGGQLLRLQDFARSVGWYWHFMGVLWIILLLLLGFWK
jgi:cytochrome c oxidase subunit 3